MLKSSTFFLWSYVQASSLLLGRKVDSSVFPRRDRDRGGKLQGGHSKLSASSGLHHRKCQTSFSSVMGFVYFYKYFYHSPLPQCSSLHSPSAAWQPPAPCTPRAAVCQAVAAAGGSEMGAQSWSQSRAPAATGPQWRAWSSKTQLRPWPGWAPVLPGQHTDRQGLLIMEGIVTVGNVLLKMMGKWYLMGCIS